MSAEDQDEHFRSGPSRGPRERSALVRQAMRVCLPEEMKIQLPGLGFLVLRPAVVEIDAARIENVRRSGEAVLIECAGSMALLFVERGFALNTVNAILGYQPVTAAGPLSRIERGILQGALVALSAHLGLMLDVRLQVNESQASPSDAIVVEVSLGLRGVAGRAWLCASDEFLTKILTTRTPSPGQSPVMIRLELGRTRVPVSELAAAREGDAVVFDGVAALPAADPWPVQIRRGEVVVPACLRPDGAVAFAGGDADDKVCGTATKDERSPARPPTRPDLAKAGAMTDFCVEIAAEIRRLQGEALAGLLCGTPLARGRGDAILLRVDDTPWAEGEIAAIDGDFAVRITRRLAG